MTGDDQTLTTRLMREDDPRRRLELIDEELCPPEPQLLDTCVTQNPDWVDGRLESGPVSWDDEALAALAARFGAELAQDLIDLGVLYKEFEHRSGYPWLVSSASEREVGRGKGSQSVRSLLAFFRGHQDDWTDDSFPGIAKGLLFASTGFRVSPLLLRGLGVKSVEEIHSETGPLSFLPDHGDRLIVAKALVANIPVVLTTDRATFWKHREKLLDFGLAVVRPTELLELYEPYWLAQDEESGAGGAKLGDELVSVA